LGVELLARAGYGARGAVYVVVGILAVLAAIGQGGGTGGSRSALAALLEQPFGWALVGILALGLACFALWRLVEAATDADQRGSEPKGLAVRAAHAISGLVYGSLAISAVAMAAGRGGGGGGEDQAARDWTRWLLAQPAGRWLAAAVALVIVGVGLSYLRRAWKGRVTDRLRLPPGHEDWVRKAGQLGFGARGVVFVIVGGFLLVAAWHARSAEARGLGGALDALRQQPYGAVLLGATALGLAAFGLFGLIQARYRRLDAPDLRDAVPDKLIGR
jgi:hypothetical protein